jgi:putative aldouronate transport system permease protein
MVSRICIRHVNNKFFKKMLKYWQLYVIILLPVLYIIIFRYVPMYGAQIAFKDFIATKGISGSPWVGFKHFERFFNSYQFMRVISNSLIISFYGLIAGFPFPIILALLLNYTNSAKYRKFTQFITYAPHFISTVVIAGMIIQFLSMSGLVNSMIKLLGFEPVLFMSKSQDFSSIFVWSGIWQNTGFESIIYFAALSNISPSLYEAAIVDGATKVQRIRHIDLPGIMPTAVIMLILNSGSILSVGFEKVYLLQNDLNLRTSEVIATYVYKVGIQSPLMDYSLPSAIGLFQSVISLILILTVNAAAKRLQQATLW